MSSAFKSAHLILIYPHVLESPQYLDDSKSPTHRQTEICTDIQEKFERIHVIVNIYHENKTTSKIKQQPNKPLCNAF